MAEVLDPQTRVDELLFIATHLIEILEQENVALAHNRFDVVNELVEQKTKLSRAYEVRVMGLEHTDSPLKGVDPVHIEELKAQGDRLQALVEANAKELAISLDTSRRFMAVLSDSVKMATPSAGIYGAKGETGVDTLPRKGTGPSIAIDENL